MNDYDHKLFPTSNWVILPSVYLQLEKDSLTRYPQEACGILLGEATAASAVIDDYVPLNNTSSQPEQHFSLEPREWVKHCYHPRLLGLFHSHPTAPPYPSQTDLLQLPLFADLLKLYVIGSCEGKRPGAKRQGANARPDFTMQGYYIIRDQRGLFALSKAELVQV